MSKNNKKKLIVLLSIFFTVLIVLVITLAVTYSNSKNKDLIRVTLDINSSIEFELDKDYNVVSISAKNDDGKEILKGIDYSKKSFKEVLNLVLTEMQKQNFIKKNTDFSALISVESDNYSDKDKLSSIVEDQADKLGYKANVYALYIQKRDKIIEKSANAASVSYGKYYFALIIAGNDKNQAEKLVKKSIDEILKDTKEKDTKIDSLIEEANYKQKNKTEEPKKPEMTTQAAITTTTAKTTKTETTTTTQPTTAAQATINSSDVSIPKEYQKYGHLTCDRIKINSDVYFGDESYCLHYGVGQYMGSKLPGFDGPTLISGHNSTYFKNLEGVKVSDVFVFTTNYGVYTYKVNKTEIFNKDDFDTSILNEENTQLILYTCWPFYEVDYVRTDRLFVYCDLVSGPKVVNIYSNE